MKKTVTFILLLFSLVALAAPTDDEAILTCSGTARTESEALDMALRSAIEQTVGAFVSSNTSIINNRLMKDEIVAISKGNIKKYDKLSTTHLPDGKICVTVKATVSVGKVVDFAVKNGATVNFDGNAYAKNAKLLKLRQDNTTIALKHLAEQIKEMCTRAYDWEVSLEQPRRTVVYDFGKPVSRTPSGVTGFLYRNSMVEIKPTAIDCYEINMKIAVKANSVTLEIFNMISSTLSALSLNKDEALQYVNMLGVKPTIVVIEPKTRDYYALPCIATDVEKYMASIAKSLGDAFYSYRIVENANNRSYVWKSGIFSTEWSSLHTWWREIYDQLENGMINDEDMFLMQAQDKAIFIGNVRRNSTRLAVYHCGPSEFSHVSTRDFVSYYATSGEVVLQLPYKYYEVINMKTPILYEYSVTLHISTDEMYSFKGYTIERTF